MCLFLPFVFDSISCCCLSRYNNSTLLINSFFSTHPLVDTKLCIRISFNWRTVKFCIDSNDDTSASVVRLGVDCNGGAGGGGGGTEAGGGGGGGGTEAGGGGGRGGGVIVVSVLGSFVEIGEVSLGDNT